MTLTLKTQQVGPWSMNTYLLICEETQTSAVIDPGDDAEKILAQAAGTQIDKILLTHAHSDHVGALAEIKAASGAPVYLHPDEHDKFGIDYDIALAGNQTLQLGKQQIRTILTPGHTPGMITFEIGGDRMVVGDTVFVGGPGRTWSHQDFLLTMKIMQDIVFAWTDHTRFFPGHGPSGMIGTERPKFEAFLKAGWPDDLQGDVTWINT
jgi:glyoxylase-like metal-dependent hydrolase (beta-lactamase superfamily II)